MGLRVIIKNGCWAKSRVGVGQKFPHQCHTSVSGAHDRDAFQRLMPTCRLRLVEPGSKMESTEEKLAQRPIHYQQRQRMRTTGFLTANENRNHDAA